MPCAQRKHTAAEGVWQEGLTARQQPVLAARRRQTLHAEHAGTAACRRPCSSGGRQPTAVVLHGRRAVQRDSATATTWLARYRCCELAHPRQPRGLAPVRQPHLDRRRAAPAVEHELLHLARRLALLLTGRLQRLGQAAVLAHGSLPLRSCGERRVHERKAGRAEAPPPARAAAAPGLQARTAGRSGGGTRRCASPSPQVLRCRALGSDGEAARAEAGSASTGGALDVAMAGWKSR